MTGCGRRGRRWWRWGPAATRRRPWPPAHGPDRPGAGGAVARRRPRRVARRPGRWPRWPARDDRDPTGDTRSGRFTAPRARNHDSRVVASALGIGTDCASAGPVGRRAPVGEAGRSERISCWAARSRSATTCPGPSARSATTVPQGPTIIEWPWAVNEAESAPTWSAAITKTWFSMARARSRTSQWARPVAAAKAEGTTMTRAPARSGAGRARGNAGRNRW